MSNSAEKYFSSIFDPINFPIQIINEEGKIIFINKAFSFQWGYNIDELREYNIFKDSELKNRNINEQIKKVLRDKESTVINNYADSLLKSRGIIIPVLRTKVFHTKQNNAEFIVLFHEDQTEMFLAEEELKKARDSNKEAERLKDTFLNVLSHELRTPLNIVMGYSSIIKESLKDKISSEDKIYLDNLYSGSERLFRSITQMLEFAQIEAGNFKLSIETVELNSLLQNCIYGIKTSAEEKKLDIKTSLNQNSIFVDADVHSLENAVNNLLSNAVKFTRQGFIEIESGVLHEREVAVCKIKDTGVGISTEYLDHLYRPFSQEDLNISRNYEGNGLGLALAKKYLEKMGGSLLVDSIKGVGSTFTFTLPLSQTVLKENGSEEKENNSEIKKIFMLDDSSDSFQLLKAFLKNEFEINVYNFRSFNLDLIKEPAYQLIIFDVNQSHWGQSLIICKELKDNDPYNRPIIVISSEFSDEKISEFFEAGAQKFLIKPFSKAELIKAIDEVTNSFHL